jgi:hypothetical protein
MRLNVAVLAGVLVAIAAHTVARAQPVADEDRDPILYATAPVNDPVARLQRKLDSNSARLEWDESHGYLPSLLAALDIDPASQSLVFSKTSFQQKLISPSRPRAIYFNDSVYIGWVQSGSVMEIASMDPQQGTIYYTLDQRQTPKPKFDRQMDNCRICHSGSMAYNIPGLMVRSVYANRVGEAFLRQKSFITDHTSPLSQRFGGWYVTGNSGSQNHMGNLMVGSESAISRADLSLGTNVDDLSRFPVNIDAYLVNTSDIVAQMTLDHQVRGHNLLVRANWDVRKAIARGKLDESAIREAVEPLVMYLLFASETPLTSPIVGSPDFAAHFTARGPRDPQGRSLREFDLQTHMMKYPLSWLIYSDEFDSLPEPAIQYLSKRLGEILTSDVPPKEFKFLTLQTRQTIIEIVKATKPQLAKSW